MSKSSAILSTLEDDMPLGRNYEYRRQIRLEIGNGELGISGTHP